MSGSETILASDDDLAIQTARLYFEGGLSRRQIAAALRMTGGQVQHLLVSARRRGYLRVQVTGPVARETGIEQELVAAFGLRTAIVVAEGPEREQSRQVARAAAHYLTGMRLSSPNLAVSCGSLIGQVAEELPPGWAHGASIVELTGSSSSRARTSDGPQAVVSMARSGLGEVTFFPFPAVVERWSTRALAEADRSARHPVDRARACDIWLFAVEGLGEAPPEEAGRLRESGAIGSVLSHYLTGSGEIADPEIDARTLGVTLTDLARAPLSIAVASGPDSREACLAVVRSGLCTHLVVDMGTARWLSGRLAAGEATDVVHVGPAAG